LFHSVPPESLEQKKKKLITVVVVGTKQAVAQNSGSWWCLCGDSIGNEEMPQDNTLR
jgi:hypothetical protein